VLAVLPRIGAGASAEAEFVVTHEASPFRVLEAGREGVPVD
jgi:hypothetical protein